MFTGIVEELGTVKSFDIAAEQIGRLLEPYRP